MKKTDSLIRVSSQILAGLAGMLLAIMIWGRANPDEIPLREKATEFSSLPTAEQERVRLAWNAFHEQDQASQSRVEQIHEAVESDPSIAAKLDEYSEWWVSLRDIQREELRAMPRDDRLKETKRKFAEDQRRRSRSELTVSFNPWMFFGRFGGRGGERQRQGENERAIPPLTLTTQQFESLIDKAAAKLATQIEVPEFADELETGDHRLLLNCLLLQQAVLDSEPSRGGIDVLESIHQTLIDHVPDQAWLQKYREKLESLGNSSRLYDFITPQLLLRSLISQLGQRLRGQIALDDETIIGEFADITDPDERKSLMLRRPSDAVRRIEQKVFVSQQSTESPERQLIQLFLATEQRVNEVMRSPSQMQRLFQPGGFGGGPGPPQNGRQPNGRPQSGPGRGSSRPQRERP